MYSGLKSFIEILEKNGELARIGDAAGTDFQIPRISCEEASKRGEGKALLFENTGFPYPVLTNLFGTEKRMLLALGADSFEKAAGEFKSVADSILAEDKGFFGKLRMRTLAGKMSSWAPKRVKGHARCQDSVQYIAKMSSLPILKFFPEDAGRCIPVAMLNTSDPVSGERSLENVRVQLLDDTTAVMGWRPQDTGRRHLGLCTHRLPVAVCLGGDPIYSFLSSLRIPEGIDKYVLAGCIKGRPVELADCLTQKLQVPADCDFVIEGYIQKSEEPVAEGPFTDSSGLRTEPSLRPKFHITCITHRSDAVFPAFVPSAPSEESAIAAAFIGRILYGPDGILQTDGIRDICFPSGSHDIGTAYVRIEKHYDGQAFKVANSLWGSEWMMFNRRLVIVDGDTDIHDSEAVRAAIEKNCIPSRDILHSRGPVDSRAAAQAALEPDFFGAEGCCTGISGKEDSGETDSARTNSVAVGEKICIDATSHVSQ